MPKTVEYCLSKVGVKTDALAACADLAEEWAAIKRAYFKTVLKTHPDKGGDPAAFRKVQSAFESLRGLFEGARSGFLFSTSASKSTDTTESPFDPSMNTPSWEFYAEAAQEAVPMYRVERAKSNRSRCCAKPPGRSPLCFSDECIEKDALRVGWMNSETGAYGGWVHLKCWRVPNRVWLGLPDPATCTDVSKFASALRSMGGVLLAGLAELSGGEMREVTRYCMDKARWARRVELKDRPTLAPPPSSSSAAASASANWSARASAASSGVKTLVAAPVASSSSAPSSESALAASRRFVVPKPGRDAKPHSLAGKTIVITGVFPELGGGAGLNLGKEKARAMCEAFGGRVTTAVSGKTDVLLVGKEPGYAKVAQAQGQGCSLLSLEDVRQGLLRGALDDVCRLRRRTPMEIDNFSAGFRGNGLGARLGHKAAPGAMARGYAAKDAHRAGPSPAGAARPSAKHGTPPNTTALISKTSAKQPAAAVEPKAKEKVGPQYTAAPLCTIDLAQLKASRFLLPPAALPYRDELGRISLHLLRDSAAKLASGALAPPDEVAKTLAKWLKHAEKEVAKGGHEWQRARDGATWTGPDGECREVVDELLGSDDEDEEAEDEPDDSDDDGDGKEAGEGNEGNEGGGVPKRTAADVAGEIAHEPMLKKPRVEMAA